MGATKPTPAVTEHPEDATAVDGGRDEIGCACVPALTPPDERLDALAQALAVEVEPVVALTQLLRLCRDEHPTLWEHHADSRWRERVAAITAKVADAMPPPGAGLTLDQPTRAALASALTAHTDGPPVVAIAHALAELLDERYWQTFTRWFRARSPYQPAVGDPIPLDGPDLREITELPPTAPPWRLANRLDETRHLRLAGAWATQFRVVFDYGAFDALGGLLTRDTVVVACQPNHSLEELDLPPDPAAPAFPVRPRDLAAQRARLEAQLAHAEVLGAGIVVVPELAVDEDLAHHLARWVRQPGPIRLLVAGSYHHTEPANGDRRANTALAWVRGHPRALHQDKHSPADRPVAEDITPTGWPELRIHVSPDGWHLVIAVCRDLLNPAAVHALTEAGANLVLAPSMSETLVPFGGPVAQLVATSQAIVAVANNPAEWRGREGPWAIGRPARALFGHPGFVRQTRIVETGDARRGIAVLRISTGQIAWEPTETAPGEGRQRHMTGAPEWVRRLASSPVPDPPAPAPLRPAAVLVLLTDGADGPQVVMTTRAADLTNYAEQVAFPGGAVDPADSGPTATALREASEEIGLDPATVEIVGALPAFALPETGFLVTPVLAWADAPHYTHPPNPGEVTSVRRLSLAGHERPDTIGVMTAAVVDLLAGRLARTGPVSGNGRTTSSL